MDMVLQHIERVRMILIFKKVRIIVEKMLCNFNIKFERWAFQLQAKPVLWCLNMVEPLYLWIVTVMNLTHDDFKGQFLNLS